MPATDHVALGLEVALSAPGEGYPARPGLGASLPLPGLLAGLLINASATGGESWAETQTQSLGKTGLGPESEVSPGWGGRGRNHWPKWHWRSSLA